LQATFSLDRATHLLTRSNAKEIEELQKKLRITKDHKMNTDKVLLGQNLFPADEYTKATSELQSIIDSGAISADQKEYLSKVGSQLDYIETSLNSLTLARIEQLEKRLFKASHHPNNADSTKPSGFVMDDKTYTELQTSLTKIPRTGVLSEDEQTTLGRVENKLNAVEPILSKLQSQDPNYAGG
jgi:hypothetical protein